MNESSEPLSASSVYNISSRNCALRPIVTLETDVTIAPNAEGIAVVQ